VSLVVVVESTKAAFRHLKGADRACDFLIRSASGRDFSPGYPAEVSC